MLFIGTNIGVVASRFVSNVPTNFRLKEMLDGEVILQGAFMWREGSEHGFDWKDMETVYE